MIPERYRSGEILYGDDFSPSEIEAWYRDEETAYSQVTPSDRPYAYKALNDFHAYNWVRKHGPFQTCLAFGCFTGKDVLPLAPHCANFLAIEPDRSVWKDEIGGTPTRYFAPDPSGTIQLDEASVDLVISLGVLHHIPNVSHVLAELVRVLKPGGILVIRETCTSMGDWTKPRMGLTPRERGIHSSWMRNHLDGLEIERFRHVMWNPVYRLPKFIKRPFNSKIITVLDWLASEACKWNAKYAASRRLDIFSPSSFYLVARKK